VRAHAAPTQRFLLPYVVTGDARGVFSLCFLMMRECLLTTHGAGWLHVSTSTWYGFVRESDYSSK
jgi:hypothetical protein